MAQALVIAAATASVLGLCSCAGNASLSSHMKQMQAQSDRLGRAIAAGDAAAAQAGLDQLSLTLAAVQRSHPRYKGVDLKRASEVILEPATQPLGEHIAASDWAAARRQYLGMVESCNRCHAATGNERIVAKPLKVR